MKLLLIHGRDQQGKDPSELKKLWIDTLEKGLKKSDLTLPSDIEIIFPYYGDLLDSVVNNEDPSKIIEGVLARGNTSTGQERFFFDFLLELSENAGISEVEIEEHFADNFKERGFLNWNWVQAILKTLDIKTPFGNLSIQKFTYDVYLYLTIPAIRKKINDFIVTGIDNSQCVVVGHSLGSIVGYNVLKSFNSPFVKKYITIGSPLGLKSIKSKLEPPICMPTCVINGWYNAYDEKDVVALNPLNSKYFDISPAIENNNTVKNHTKNHHGIEGYLDDKEIAKIIYEAIT